MDCEDIDEFYDGELCAAAAARFRAHLAGCRRCQLGLHDRMQVAVFVARLRGRTWTRAAHDTALEALASAWGAAGFIRALSTDLVVTSLYVGCLVAIDFARWAERELS